MQQLVYFLPKSDLEAGAPRSRIMSRQDPAPESAGFQPPFCAKLLDRPILFVSTRLFTH